MAGKETTFVRVWAMQEVGPLLKYMATEPFRGGVKYACCFTCPERYDRYLTAKVARLREEIQREES